MATADAGDPSTELEPPPLSLKSPVWKYFGFLGTIAIKELNTRPLEVFMCSVLKRQGYGEGFRWLSQYID